MTDDLVQRLRRTYRKEFPVTGSMIADNSNRLRPFPILAAEVPFNPDGREAANRIESQAAEIERLKVQLSVETEPSPYCPICGSCGEEGCCGSKRCMYPDTGIEADREQAAAEERAKIVAWLRNPHEHLSSKESEDRLVLASGIEASEHIPLQGTGQ